MVTVTKTGSPSGLIILGFIFLIFGALMMFNNSKESGFKAKRQVLFHGI